jgi:hypothetical protein
MQQPPDTPKPLYLSENPSLPKEGEQEFVILKIPKAQYDRMIEIVDLRPWKKRIKENEIEDSLVRKVAMMEKDFVRRCDFECTLGLYFMFFLVEGIERSREQERINP